MLDDSTDRTTRDLVDDKVVEWRERGVNIEVMRRTNRAGYKAGALKEVSYCALLWSALLGGIRFPHARIDTTVLLQGLERLAEYDYVAIFDADFKPDTDFLVSDRTQCAHVCAVNGVNNYCDACCFYSQALINVLLLQTLTVPYLIDNPEVGYVQTRWVFANPDESYLTKVQSPSCERFLCTVTHQSITNCVHNSQHSPLMHDTASAGSGLSGSLHLLQAQEISLNFHCKCEQYVQFATGGFFNFNGTAGIWRRKTIVTVGGWKSRTTVEDMDLSLRTFVNGWKAIYLTETTCINEVPPPLNIQLSEHTLPFPHVGCFSTSCGTL